MSDKRREFLDGQNQSWMDTLRLMTEETDSEDEEQTDYEHTGQQKKLIIELPNQSEVESGNTAKTGTDKPINDSREKSMDEVWDLVSKIATNTRKKTKKNEENIEKLSRPVESLSESIKVVSQQLQEVTTKTRKTREVENESAQNKNQSKNRIDDVNRSENRPGSVGNKTQRKRGITNMEELPRKVYVINDSGQKNYDSQTIV